MTQPLARLAFYLIAPTSDDGLVTWNVLDDLLGEGVKTYPILRSRGFKVQGSGGGGGGGGGEYLNPEKPRSLYLIVPA